MPAEGAVRRKRLFDLLAAASPIKVVAAPSGYGKTTLVRTWIDTSAGEDRVVVWVTLSADVPSRRSFWQLVVTSASRRAETAAAERRRVASEIGTGDDPLETVIEFLDGLGPAVLVLDAYEHVRDPAREVDDDLLRLAESASHLDIVVTTRATTALTDESALMRGLVRSIDESDLRFSSEETAQLLEVHAPQVIDAAERIVRDTAGYPLAVRAATHALANLDGLPSLDGTAWQRLVTEDLRSQISDPAIVDFVLDSSVPPYFDRHLAGELADGADVDRALDELAWNGFGRWIPYARDRPVFQYVDSVRDVFRARLRADDPSRYERDAGVSAAWLHRSGDHDLALTLAIDARRFDMASDICGSIALANPDIYTSNVFERHLRQVPRAALVRHPTLAFFRAMAYAANPATRGSAAEYFRLAATHALDGLDRMAPREAFHQYVGLAVCLRYLGRTQDAALAVRDGLAALEAMSTDDRDELGDYLAMALTICAYSLLQVGDTERAGTLVEEATTTSVLPWWRNYTLGFAVGIHALDGRGRRARAALAISDPDVLREHGRRLPHVLGVLGQATLRLDDLDVDGALQELDRAEWLLDVAESWPFIRWVTMHARLGSGHAGAEAHRVAASLTATPRPPGIGPNLGTAAMLDALAISWLAAGQAARGRPLLRTNTPCPGQLAPARMLYELVTGDPALAVRSVVELLAEPGHTVRSTAAVETLGAAAALRVGSLDTAAELLSRAAAAYELHGVRAHLLYLPDVDLRSLAELAAERHDGASTEFLSGRMPTPIAFAETAAVPLTRREIEVLRAWAAHDTRADVAAALFVSPNTVRSQLRSAYRKLGVTSKDGAIQRALELDLLR